jgi:hypothetical protein
LPARLEDSELVVVHPIPATPIERVFDVAGHAD